MSDLYYDFCELTIETQKKYLDVIGNLSVDNEFFKNIYQKLLNDNAIVNYYGFADDITCG